MLKNLIFPLELVEIQMTFTFTSQSSELKTQEGI
jgi:hypothetical protein